MLLLNSVRGVVLAGLTPVVHAARGHARARTGAVAEDNERTEAAAVMPNPAILDQQRKAALARARSQGNRYLVLLLALAALAVVGLEVLRNNRPPDGLAWDRLQLATGISPADVTVIVLGLLTVVAALSIALVTALPGVGTTPEPDEFAARAVWGLRTRSMSNGFAVTGTVVAVTQFANDGTDQNLTRATLLTCIAIGGLCLASSTATLSYEADIRRYDREFELQHVEAVRSSRCAAAAGRRTAGPLWRPAAAFVLVVAATCLAVLGVELALLTAAGLAHLRGHTPAWWTLVAVMPVALVATATGICCRVYWPVELEVQRSQRMVVRGCLALLLLLHVLSVALGVAATGRPASALVVTTVLLFPPALTLALLHRARHGARLGNVGVEHLLRQAEARALACREGLSAVTVPITATAQEVTDKHLPGSPTGARRRRQAERLDAPPWGTAPAWRPLTPGRP